MLIAQCARALQVGPFGRQHAALALDRLQYHSAGLLGNSRLECFQVVVRHMGNAADLRPEAIRILGLPADVDGKQGTSVETVECRNDLVLVLTVAVMGYTPRQLEGGLISLGTAVAKKYPLGKGRFDQLA